MQIIGRELTEEEEINAVSESFIRQLGTFGFPREHSELALRICHNKFDSALEVLLAEFKNVARPTQPSSFSAASSSASSSTSSLNQSSSSSSSFSSSFSSSPSSTSTSSSSPALVQEEKRQQGDQGVKQVVDVKEKERQAEEIKMIRKDELVHKAAWLQDTASLAYYLKLGLAEEKDRYGNTPLHLAFALGHYDVVSFLMGRGADPRSVNCKGWTILQEAVLVKNVPLALDTHLQTTLFKQAEWERKLPILMRSLESIPDFYMEIEWKVESWVPLLSSFTPSDVFKIWKKGSNLRMDSTFRGMSGMKAERGLTSFVFNQKSLYLVDHVAMTRADALAKFRRPSYDRLQLEVESMMEDDEVARAGFNNTNVVFKRKTNLFGMNVSETLHDYVCSVMEMEGLEFRIISLQKGANKNDSSTPSDNLPSFDEYFQLEANNGKSGGGGGGAAAAGEGDKPARSKIKGNPLLVGTEGIEVKKKPIDNCSLWMATNFPLSMPSLRNVLDLVAPVSNDLTKVRDILDVPHLPPGFPVRMVVPVMSQVNAVVTFGKYEKTSCDDSIFELPQGFTKVRHE